MKTKKLLLCSLFCALNIVFAQFILPAGSVHLSLGIIPVLLCALTLAPRYAFFTQVAYLLLGVAGLPVFGKFCGGIGALLGPTGGFLMSYPVMALVCSYLFKKLKRKTFFAHFICQLPALLICYISGSFWLSHISSVTFYYAFLIGCVPFIAFDIVKLTVCAFVAPAIRKSARLR